MLARSYLAQASDLIEARTGLSVPLDELYPVLAQLGGRDIAAYLQTLRGAPETSAAWQPLIAALTVGETYFLRDQSHFHLLRAHILPELVTRRRDTGDLHLNIWSVGCASGEEPYSLAVTLHETLPDIAQWQVRLFGTDINADALHTARRGVFRKWAFRHTDADFQTSYFDEAPGGLMIRPLVRDMVSFRHANLLGGPPLPRFDLILCRNVLLYFSAQQVYRAEDLLYEALDPGGWLLLGASESIRHHREQWTTHVFPGAPVYQRPLTQPTLRPGEFAYQHHHRPATVSKRAVATLITYDDAVRAVRAEDYDHAESLLFNLLRTGEQNAAVHTLLARVYANRSRPSDAHDAIARALEIDPLMADAHYLRAELFIEAGDSAQAVEALRATLYCQRNHPLAAFLLGNLYAQDGDLTRARRHWSNARRALAHFTPQSPLSEVSDLTAGQLGAMIAANLDAG